MNTHVTRRRRLELLWNIKDIVNVSLIIDDILADPVTAGES